ncbi:hypothetical protein Btru_014908 [Bulinus truncatus]|nr:hypothetical protein Btru_014908 [Bulinus truncatus]
MESVELKEVHTSLGVTNSQSFNLEVDDGAMDTTGFRMAPTVPRSFTHSHSTPHGFTSTTTTVVRRRSSAHVPPRRRRLLSHFRQKAKSIKVKIPRVQDVNTIDKYARLVFPLLFVIFNTSYWSVYLLT